MREGRARKIAATGVIVACVAFVAAGIARDFDRVELEAFEWPSIARAAGVLLAAYLLRALAFGVLVGAMDRNAPLLRAALVFLASQLGRYVPGKVWQVAGAGYFASQAGISATASVLGTAYYVVIHNLVGGLLGLWVLLRMSPAGESMNATAALGVVGLLVIALASSPMFPRLIRRIGRLVGRELEVQPIPIWAVLSTVASSLCVWSLFGVAVCDVFRGALPGSEAPDLVSAIAIMAAASVAGLAVLIVPSGLGVREAVFVAALSGSYTMTESGLVAVVLRILMSGLELLLALIGIGRLSSGRTPDSGEPR